MCVCKSSIVMKSSDLERTIMTLSRNAFRSCDYSIILTIKIIKDLKLHGMRKGEGILKSSSKINSVIGLKEFKE